MDAKLKQSNEHGVELRHASRKSDSWPGYGIPLGKAGYWVGTDRRHDYLGRSVDKRRLEIYDFA